MTWAVAGVWGVHTPDAMCKAAAVSLHDSAGAKAVGGSCKSHGVSCAQMVLRALSGAAQRVDDIPKRPLVWSADEAPAVDDFK